MRSRIALAMRQKMLPEAFIYAQSVTSSPIRPSRILGAEFMNQIHSSMRSIDARSSVSVR
jgi:hypothetical protein